MNSECGSSECIFWKQARSPKMMASHAQICNDRCHAAAWKPGQNLSKAQMFSIIRRRAWFYTSPVSVCQLGAAPVVYMCMTKMNHQMVLAKFQHHFWTPCSCQFAGLLECRYSPQKRIKERRVARFAVLGPFFFIPLLLSCASESCMKTLSKSGVAGVVLWLCAAPIQPRYFEVHKMTFISLILIHP